MLSRLKMSLSSERVFTAPEGERLYAIGDLHGRVDLLDRLMAGIEQDMTTFEGERLRLIFLGDYVDRGPDSKETLTRLMQIQKKYDHVNFLLGNHEEAMMTFLKDPKDGEAWLDYGGLETLDSYGVSAPSPQSSPQALEKARNELAKKLPKAHKTFLESLRLSVTYGDYFFVHAGVRPGIALDEQQRHDLLWIRDEFLTSDWSPGKIVVHGHTPGERPQLARWRIGVDTGAYATGRLTCIVLENDTKRFLSTRKRI